MIAMAAGLVVYVFRNTIRYSSVSAFVKAPNNQILLISTIIAKIPPFLSGTLMGVGAIGYAYDWMKSSASNGEDMPTPAQYSLLLRICGSADILTLVDGLLYRRKVSRPSSKHPKAPPILKHAVVHLALVIGFVQLIGVMDALLHYGVRPIALATFSVASQTNAFGRQINQTFCDENGPPGGVNDPNWPAGPCYSVALGGNGPDMPAQMEGLAAAANTSVNEIIMVDGIALAMDRNRGQATFTAQTYGWYTSCVVVSSQCALTSFWPVSTSFSCIDHPAWSVSVDNAPLGLDISSFNESGTNWVGSERNNRTNYGAWSQPLEFGVLWKTTDRKAQILYAIVSDQLSSY